MSQGQEARDVEPLSHSRAREKMRWHSFEGHHLARDPPHPHFTDEETEAQKREGTSSRQGSSPLHYRHLGPGRSSRVERRGGSVLRTVAQPGLYSLHAKSISQALQPSTSLDLAICPTVGHNHRHGLDVRCAQKLTCETIQEGLEEKCLGDT